MIHYNNTPKSNYKLSVEIESKILIINDNIKIYNNKGKCYATKKKSNSNILKTHNFKDRSHKIWLGRYYDYIRSNEMPLSLSCPADGCKYGSLKKYDSYDDESKGKLLINKQNNFKQNDEVSWN